MRERRTFHAMGTTVELLLSGPTEGRVASIALATRLIAGGIFIAFGAGKFLNHGSELASFQSYGLPAPDLFEAAIGVLELLGGVALIFGFGTRMAAFVLAGDMVGAILVSGLAHGELISLTLAPAQLHDAPARATAAASTAAPSSTASTGTAAPHRRAPPPRKATVIPVAIALPLRVADAAPSRTPRSARAGPCPASAEAATHNS